MGTNLSEAKDLSAGFIQSFLKQVKKHKKSTEGQSTPPDNANSEIP